MARNALTLLRTVRTWPVYIADYWGLIQDGPIEMTLRTGEKFRIRPGTVDREILSEIWMKRVYNPPGYELSHSDVVVDIGAHIGLFTVLASRCSRAGRIIAYEPMEDNYRMLMDNIALNSAKNVVPVNSAVFDCRGVKDIALCESNTGGHSLNAAGGCFTRVPVNTVTLKDVLLENNIDAVDFLKLDCEGSEYEILMSSGSETMNSIRKISLEYHSLDARHSPRILVDFLRKNDFIVTITPSDVQGIGMIYATRRREQ